jgi:hypothetical protein
MNNGGIERTSGTGAFDDVHPWDSAMQGSNPSAGRASNPAGPGGGDIDWVGQPAGSSGKRRIPWGSGDRVPPGARGVLCGSTTNHAVKSPLARPSFRRFTPIQNTDIRRGIFTPWFCRTAPFVPLPAQHPLKRRPLRCLAVD